MRRRRRYKKSDNFNQQLTNNPFSFPKFICKPIDNSVSYYCYYCHAENKINIGSRIECKKCKKNIFIKKRQRKSMNLFL